MASSSRRNLLDDDISEFLNDSNNNSCLSDSEFEDQSSESDFQENDTDFSETDDENESSEAEDNAMGAGDAGPDIDSWRQWHANDVSFEEHAFTVQNPGYQSQFARPRPSTELHYFQLFFTDSLLEVITAETNRYAAEKIGKEMPLRKHSLWNSWHNVSLDEMKAFLGIILNMALHEKPNIKSYFSEEWSEKQPFFKDVFSRTRFLQIFWALHVSPPSVPANRGIQSRGQKVRNVVEYIDNKCRENYVPGQKIAIDESTIGFKGRVVFKMYNPQKPTKWGLRVYVLADCATGYVSVLLPYYGTATTQQLIRPELPFTSRIVLQLCSTLLETTNGSGYHLYTDRFYTGYDLAQELLSLKIHTTGTVMSNRRGLPADIAKQKKMKIQKHEVVAFRKNKTMVLVWKDKRPVHMLSTLHNPSTDLVTRKVAKGEVEEFQKPRAIIDYTQHMGAVDRADHYCASYSFTRKSLKWWRKMFFWLLEVSVVNSFILCNIQRGKENMKPVSHLKYRKELLLQLVGNVRNQSLKRGRPSSSDQEERLRKIPHFIASNPKSNSKDCSVCSDRKIQGGRRETVYFCDTCSRKPGLHPGDCFKKYHTMKKYKN